MQIFITGTDTDIGKTLVSSWLCLHTGYSYFKPIQTGNINETDSQIVKRLANCQIHPESYNYIKPESPYIAAKFENETIDIDEIQLPEIDHLIIEGSGGILVPINQGILMVDLIKKFNIPTIIVSNTRLGTINHTLLTLEALRARNIRILGIIMIGEINQPVCDTIEYHGNIEILAQIPLLKKINTQILKTIQLPNKLKKYFNQKN